MRCYIAAFLWNIQPPLSLEKIAARSSLSHDLSILWFRAHIERRRERSPYQ